MQEAISIEIGGIEETIAMLKAAPKNIQRAAMGKALIAACVPVVQALEPRTPVADYPAGMFASPGSLADHIVTDVMLFSDGSGGMASVGFGKYGAVANFLEYGHRMVGHKPDLKALGLGEVPPHPFMRVAAAESAEAAIDAFAASLNESFKAGIPGIPKVAA